MLFAKRGIPCLLKGALVYKCATNADSSDFAG